MRHSEIHLLRMVLGDPDATEQQWVQAADKMKELDAPNSPIWHRAAWKYPLLSSIPVCMLASFAMCVYVKLGYDWGYRLVETMFGQPEHQAMNQGILALLLLPHIVFPLNLGLAFACFKRYFGTPKYWRRILLLCTAVETIFWYVGLDMSGTEGPFLSAWCLTGFAVAYLAFTIGYSVLQRFFTYWNVQLGGFINFRATFPLCALYLVPSFLLGLIACLNMFNLDKTPVIWEGYFYALPLFILGFRAARHSQSIFMAVNSALMVLSPLLVANVFTLLGTSFCSILDIAHLGPDLGWRAPYSAVLINFLTFGATISGCILGNASDRLLRRVETIRHGISHSA